MEILILVLLYYLTQNPNFSESVKPLMAQIKDSEQMLSFLKDLSKFSQTLGCFQQSPPAHKPEKENPDNMQKPENGHGEAEKSCQADKKEPQSPTKGIADDFIQNILDKYLKNQVKQ